MFRRLLIPALVAVLAAAAPVALAARAGAPTHLICQLPGKNGKPGLGIYIDIKKDGGMRAAVQACFALGGHPAGVSNGKK